MKKENLLDNLFLQSKALKDKAWKQTDYEECVKTRIKEKELYEKYLLLKGIKKANDKIK